MQIMPINRHDSSLPISHLEQGFNIDIFRSGESPVRIRIVEDGLAMSWGRKRFKAKTSTRAIVKAQEWLGYEHLMFQIVFDESPD